MQLSYDFGQSFPLGATPQEGGVNFCVFSKYAESVELLLFDHHDDPAPTHTIGLDPEKNRTFYYWHIFIKDIKPGQLYGYRVHGPYDLALGMRFDARKVLLDPYARAASYGDQYDRNRAASPLDNTAQSMKAVVVDTRDYDWEGDRPLNYSFSNSVIYEMHVGGFTKHPSSGVAEGKRGTYAGLVEKIPYLKSLGITAVELLPVHQFDPQFAPPGLANYWGYQSIAFFAPHRDYSSDLSPLGPVKEFRDMIKAMHKAGIEVILDVVFNHTAEGDHLGPTLSFRGFENIAYYLLEPDGIHYKNFSGTGNTLNANHSIVRRLIRDCLRYWVQEMHVDGFRFDLASVLARGESGQPLENPPLLWEIESDPVLAGTKIIAEAWDAAGLYQVGSFVGHRWAEWNGQYRDDVRRFIRGEQNTVRKLAARMVGSPDLYPQPDREPNRSINFVTAHDGFTLNDLVSYNRKHNEANGERNRDGLDENFSWNCGTEGPSLSPHVNALRTQQIKNFLVILLMSQGTPMLQMGDEVLRTQHGNNNAYCQDNEISWLNWGYLNQHQDIYRFTRLLTHFTKPLKALQQERFLRHTNAIPGLTLPAVQPDPAKNGSKPTGQITWHGIKLEQPDWSSHSHSLAFTLVNASSDGYQNEWTHVMVNAYWEPLTFEIPNPPDGVSWHLVADTGKPGPFDIYEPNDQPAITSNTYTLAARTAAILTGKRNQNTP